MIITTSARTNSLYIQMAKQIASDLGVNYHERGRDSIQDLQEALKEEVLVVGKNRLELYIPSVDQSIFFHPNSAMFRMKRLLSGNHDPFVEACQLSQGMSILDCTLGLGSDSIVASYSVGSGGRVTSLEGSKTLAYLVQTGLKTWDTQIPVMNDSMRAIQIVSTPYQDYLKKCQDKSMDVIYFDPMFEDSIEGSVGLQGVKKLAIYDDLTEESIEEAKRVATGRIVLKDHWRSNRFERLGFTPIHRKSANFHYGVIELG
ncbi:class I SAM-dependent methyltransferase [Bacillus sp. DJP31]|uniref:class I SAM-dependent methyltransferase n=1 Tax=Bacillus sp. DJP31 TaxID=3409789 RepID=UPI003BB49E49